MSEKEREEIIRYGIKRGVVIFISTLITIMCGWFLGIVWQSVFFGVSISVLRKYIGGYHSNTEKKCYVISFITVLTSLLGIKMIKCGGELGIALQTICLVIVLLIAPVENVNHILDKDERIKYGNKGRNTEILLYLIYVSLYFVNRRNISVAIGTANLIGTIFLVIGYIKIHKVK